MKCGFRCAISLDSWQEEHEEIRVKRGEKEALQWEDYKSMSFTQCVSTFYYGIFAFGIKKNNLKVLLYQSLILIDLILGGKWDSSSS